MLRRGIIVFCFILLIPLIINAFSSLSRGKYYSSELKAQVKDGSAEVIEIGKRINIDGDSIFIERIINTDAETNIRYRTFERPGWSFPESAIVLYDEKGKKQRRGSASSGSTFGQDGVIIYDRINEESKEIRIKFEWFDRSGEITVPVYEGGKK